MRTYDTLIFNKILVLHIYRSLPLNTFIYKILFFHIYKSLPYNTLIDILIVFFQNELKETILTPRNNNITDIRGFGAFAMKNFVNVKTNSIVYARLISYTLPIKSSGEFSCIFDKFTGKTRSALKLSVMSYCNERCSIAIQRFPPFNIYWKNFRLP